MAFLGCVRPVLRPDFGDAGDLIVGVLLQPLQVRHQVGLLRGMLDHARMS
jgi:hypothetical protein